MSSYALELYEFWTVHCNMTKESFVVCIKLQDLIFLKAIRMLFADNNIESKIEMAV